MPVGDRGVEPLERAHVLAAEVDVDERCDLAVVEELPAERGIARGQVLEHLPDRRAGGVHLALAADLGAQRRGNPDGGYETTPRGAWQNST